MPTHVTVSYLKEQNLKKKAYILATPAVKHMFESNDIMCSSDVGVSVLFLHFFLHSPCSVIVSVLLPVTFDLNSCSRTS